MEDQKGTLLLLAIAGGYMLLYFGLLLILALCQVNPPLAFIILAILVLGVVGLNRLSAPRTHSPPLSK
jgi:hypothetical protein